MQPTHTPATSAHSLGARPLCLSVTEAAQQLGLGRTMVFALIKNGELESIAIGRRRVVPYEALETFVSRLRTTQRIA